ncbi:MAG: PAS domain-containing protein [Ardenticatenaceae bacterium]|nr:PAS domain-containing protein [Ardenticatenaceae bacterium]
MDSTLDILANTGDAVCAINKEKRVVYWNSAAEKILNITAEDAIGQPCWELMKGKTVKGQPFCAPDCPIHSRINKQEAIPHFDLWIEDKNGKAVLTNFSTISVPQQKNSHPQSDQAVIIHLMRAVKNRDVPQHHLRINVLGPLNVLRTDDSKVDGKYWHRAKVRGLFILLALKRGKPATREELIEALWPELDSTTALRNLNTTIYNLRRSLEPQLKQGNESNYIFYETGHYWLGGSQPHWIDVDAFTLGIQQARMETAVDKAIYHYEEAVKLYQGDYLVDLITTTGIGSATEQTRLRQLFLNALEELGNLYQLYEQTEKARNTYLKILAIDPHRESAYHQLARLSHGTNTLMDSVAYCQRLAAALKDELDLILSQEMPCQENKRRSGKL